ncbi:hypothetical protein [Actinoallomurus rhizosphaericola]|uniref:hypothetical protein n=1 Tax=Actinoallomurus rhizosphaericola TaxID=2952536 RepID=UPI00209147B9|nr:hypothetical protein [Actinoallomurus rhizosphaericola]MCO5994333.1 hypothetical protein [Actinoallomurus rhizosphaericola]
MTRWRRSPTRRSGQGGRDDAAARTGPGNHGAARANSRAAVVVDEYDELILLRSSPDAAPRPEDVAELARALVGGDEYFTLVVGADGAGGELWARLGTVLDSLRAKGVTAVRLVLSGAGARRAGRPALAQRIADAWGIEVIAPDAGVLILPGGSLLARGGDGPGHGWQSFTPGAEPSPLGPRSPAPAWQPALTRLPGRTAGGYVVEQVPAGILVRSAREPRAWAADLCYSVPVDGAHLTVLVCASRLSGDAEVPAEEIASLLTALPASTRSTVRLAPCGPVDLLSLAQDTAEMLGADVEVWTGLPLVVGSETEPVVRPVLIGADAEPTWAPFVEAVACRPYGADGTDGPAAPRLLRWRSPLAEGARTDGGVVRLSDRWQVAVTRSGLVVGPHGEPPAVAGRPVSPEQLAIEVDLRGATADDALFAGLSRLLSDLGTGVREFVSLHRAAPPAGSDDAGFRLLRLAIEHNVSLVEPKPVEAVPAPAPPTVRTVATPRAAPPTAESAASQPGPTASQPVARAEAPAAAAAHPAPAAGRPAPASAPVNAAGPAADEFAPPAPVTLPDLMTSSESAQADSPGRPPEQARPLGPVRVRGDLPIPGRANPPARVGERSTPPPGDDPSPRPEPRVPPASTVQDPTRADPPAPTRSGRGSGERPLPPSLARIPMTPVTPREPAAPEGPEAPAEPASAPRPPASPEPPAATEPPAELRAPAAFGSPAVPQTPATPGSPQSSAAADLPDAPHPPAAPEPPAVSQGPATPSSPQPSAAADAPGTPHAPAVSQGPAMSSTPYPPAASGSPVPEDSPAAPDGPAMPEPPVPPGSLVASGPPTPHPSPATSQPPPTSQPRTAADPPASGGVPATSEPPAAAQAPAAPEAQAERPLSPAEHRARPAATVVGGARSGPAVKPLRRSTEAERTKFRSLVQPIWERHSAAVNRAMTRMPALRGGQVDAARIDLVAVHVHLSGGLSELDGHEPGSPGGHALPEAYLACLASGLSRLPSYRGAAARGGLPADGDLERFVPGTVLHEPGPVSALPIGDAAGLPAAGGYVIWSSTGRRVRPLAGSGSGTGPEEIVFPPGTAFRVLGVRSAGQAPIVLLSEIIRAGSGTGDRPGVLGDADRAALERLDEALRRQAPTTGAASPAAWPVRCAAPLGEASGWREAASRPGEPPAPPAF